MVKVLTLAHRKLCPIPLNVFCTFVGTYTKLFAFFSLEWNLKENLRKIRGSFILKQLILV